MLEVAGISFFGWLINHQTAPPARVTEKGDTPFFIPPGHELITTPELQMEDNLPWNQTTQFSLMSAMCRNSLGITKTITINEELYLDYFISPSQNAHTLITMIIPL